MWPTSSTRPGAADTPPIIILDSETNRKTGATVQSTESKRAHTAAVSDTIGIDRTDADSSWQAYQTRLMFRGWPRQSGIVNRVRPQSRGVVPSEATNLQRCIETIKDICGGGEYTIEHKIGICYDAATRWEFHTREAGNDWIHRVMVLLERPSCRESAGYLEAALISWVESSKYYSTNSINIRRGDHGGTGPRLAETSNRPFYVYLVIRVLWSQIAMAALDPIGTSSRPCLRQ